MPEPDFPDFELIPATDDDFPPEQELAEAADPFEIPPAVESDDTIPLGKSWYINLDSGTGGAAPPQLYGHQSVVMWAQLALVTQRFSCPIFSDDFGMEEPHRLIGQAFDAELVADYIADVKETLKVHDRISDVRDFDFVYFADDTFAQMSCLLVIDDEPATLTVPVPTNNTTVPA